MATAGRRRSPCQAAGLLAREGADPAYLEFAFPYSWHYDVLRALRVLDRWDRAR